MQQFKNTKEVDHRQRAIEVRSPRVKDAAEIWRLVSDCGVLDVNSPYAYLLICRDFSATSLVATMAGRLVGFVAAYIPPRRPDVIFVWQIGVSPTARGQGLARSLLVELLALPACRDVTFLEATVTPSNTASRRLFESLARTFGGELYLGPGFSTDDLGTARHEPENTVRISLIGSRHEDL